MTPFWTVYAVVLLLLALGSGLLVHAQLKNDSGLVKPPDVVGLPQNAAISQLATFGLRVERVVGAYSPKPVGTVIEQNPDANFSTKPGSTVDLKISAGVERAQVPRLIGLMQTDAQADLATIGLTLAVQTRDANAPAGLVLNISPPPGSVVPARSKVTLVVASGLVPVPNVRSMTVDMAISVLGQLGFGIGIRPVPSTITPGTVLDQRPGIGPAPRGSDVIIDVAGDPATTPVPNSTAPPTPSPTPAPAPTATKRPSPTHT